MTPDTLRKIDEIANAVSELTEEFRNTWREGILFTWQWWLLLALTVLPWVFWALWHRRDSTHRLLFAGFFSIIVAKLLDSMGVSFGLWEYTARVIPLMPPYFPWDTTLMPVAVMVFIQFKPKIHPVIKALVFAAVASFLLEPLAIWLQLYRPISWKHLYSFPIFIVIYLVADWLSKRDRFVKISA